MNNGLCYILYNASSSYLEYIYILYLYSIKYTFGLYLDKVYFYRALFTVAQKGTSIESKLFRKVNFLYIKFTCLKVCLFIEVNFLKR